MAKLQVKVSADVIDPAPLFGMAHAPGNGACVIFTGAVREQNAGKQVVAVSYDAFEPLAEATLRAIATEAAAKWGESLSIAVIHRTGKLAVGELSIAIVVGSPHRDEAYQASRYIIEQTKIRVPIWKKEHYADGETEWLRGHALCSHGDHA